MSWLEDAGGSCLEFGILVRILIWTLLLVFDTPMFWILAVYIDFKVKKNIHVF